MTPSHGSDIRNDAALDPLRVRVNLTGRGWEITLPDQPESMTCETLDDAARIAYGCAAVSRPCEVIVQDGYHRILYHELIDDRGEPRDTRPQRAPKPGSRWLTAGSQLRSHGVSPGGAKR